jgi:hypothetical protein
MQTVEGNVFAERFNLSENWLHIAPEKANQ